MNKIKLYLSQEYNRLKEQQDPLADLAILDLLQHPNIIDEINSWQNLPKALPESYPDSIKAFFEFYTHPFPGDKSPKEMLKVQDLFLSNAPLMLSLLGFYALPYTYAFGDGAEVLVRSKRMVNDPGKRLAETAWFILECYRPGAFVSDMRILLVLAKVRLIHAFSRHFINKYDKSWNPEWGAPINQEDMIATNLTFSLLIYRGMQKAGKTLSLENKVALLKYWKVIGYYLGLKIDFWPDSPKEAFELEKIIRMRHLRSSEAGFNLINSLIRQYKKEIISPALAPFSEDLIAFFIGKECSRILGLKPKQSLPETLLSRLIAFSVFGLGGVPKSYNAFYRQFTRQTHDKYGEDIGINIPVRR